VGKIKGHILGLPQPGSVVEHFNPDKLIYQGTH